MRLLTSCCITAAVGCCAFAAAACETPSLITIPDGATSTKDQLLAAQAQVKSYMAAMQQYLSCVDDEMAAKGDDATAVYKKLMIDRHNTAVSEMESVAGAFNDQVKAFKAASQPGGAAPAKK